MTKEISKEELEMLEIIRKYVMISPRYSDYKIEVRDGRIARVIPTISIPIAEIKSNMV